MGSQEKYSGYKLEVLSKLRHRNENERKRYESIVNLTNNLYELLDYHLKENVRLRVSKAHLEQDVIDLQRNPDASVPRPVERTYSGKNFLLLQDELTELLKQKAEYAQQVIVLRSSNDEKEKEIAAKTLEIQELETQLRTTEQLLQQVQQKLKETDHNLQFVKDEYDALLITYTTVEEKKTKLEKENQELIARFIQLKALDADKLNAETESFQRFGKVRS
uniref:Autophagy-related protein 16-1 n=1 Tax=Parasteatoda tepidariorum TaxID=114398 RepID=A0A2L2YBC3_PARTP